METLTIHLSMKNGMHIRPAAMFVKEAKKFLSQVEIRKGELSANGKSLSRIQRLNLSEGETITLFVDGDDEKEASKVLGQFLEGLK